MKKKNNKKSRDWGAVINIFAKSWTIKESYIIYLGIGLKYGMKRISINYEEVVIDDGTDVVCCFSKEFGFDYYLSICSRVRKNI
ncbi:hypothetical protein [Ruminococcus sp.]|uniref:hypothetical protein n=1 Tax=Ruminococcus sp. TaxID=41978 RepID=UPI00388D9B63